MDQRMAFGAQPLDHVTVALPAWVAQWAAQINRVRAHVVRRTELLYGPPVDDRAKEFLRPRMTRDIQRELVAYLDEQGLLMLEAAPVEELWFQGAVEFRLRFLACERAPVPPVEEWERFS